MKSITNTTTRPKSERDINPLSFLGPQSQALGSSNLWDRGGGGLGGGGGVGLGGNGVGVGNGVNARIRSLSHEVVTLTLSNPSLNHVNLNMRNYAPRLSCQYADSEVCIDYYFLFIVSLCYLLQVLLFIVLLFYC